MGKYFTQIKEKTKQFTKKEWTIVAIVIALIIALAGFGIYKGLTPSNKKQGWFTTEQGTMYYVDGKEVTGWLNDEETSNKYYFDENGIMQTGFVELDKSTYYFDKEDGHMLTGWQTIENKKYYFEDNGKMKTGICKVGEDTYCFGDGGAMVTGEKEIDGVTYDFGTDGKMKLKEGETSVEVKQDDQGNTVIEIKKEDGSTVENVVSASSSINQAPANAKVETPVSNNTQTTTKPSSGSSSSNNSNASSSSSNTSTTKPSGNNSSSNNNTNNNNSSNSNTSSSSKPSGGNNNISSSTTTPSGTGSNSNSNSNSGSNSSSTTPSKPSHTHNWVEVTKTVHHDEVGHNETYQELVKDAWDEKVPVYEQDERCICNGCGADITGNTSAHNKNHALKGEPGGWHTEWKDVLVRTDIVHHDAEYTTKTRYVVDKEAYDETVVTGYKCSECGQTK